MVVCFRSGGLGHWVDGLIKHDGEVPFWDAIVFSEAHG
jgi:hypothetical protein